MPSTTIDLPDELLARIRKAAAIRQIPAREVVNDALTIGVNIVEQRLSALMPKDRATLFKRYLVEQKGLQRSSARTLSSLARKAARSGDLDVFVAAAPPSTSSSVRHAVSLWKTYCDTIGIGFYSLEL